MMDYPESEYLQLSALQHFAFCRRQWGLIHLEQQWVENYHTADGRLGHKNAHDGLHSESRPNRIITRGMAISSPSLGISGECDIVEFNATSNGIYLAGKPGLWQPYPIEYKRTGKAATQADHLQLCAQTMCLEEMLCCVIPEGAIYSIATKKRTSVLLDEALRAQVTDFLAEMHALTKRGHTPRVKKSKACAACSLQEVCLPKLEKTTTVQTYLQKFINNPEEEGG